MSWLKFRAFSRSSPRGMWLAKPAPMDPLRWFSKSSRAASAAAAAVIVWASLPAGATAAASLPLETRFSQVLTVDAYAAGDSLVDSWGTPEPIETPAEAPAPERDRAFSDLKPARDIGRGLRVLASDTRAVFEAPFHMDRGDALWTLGTMVVAGALYSQDQQVLDAVDRNSENEVLHAAIQPGRALEKLGFIGSTAPYYAAGLTLGYVMRWDPVTEMTAEVLESHFIAGVVRNLLEGAVGRSRPRSGQGRATSTSVKAIRSLPATPRWCSRSRPWPPITPARFRSASSTTRSPPASRSSVWIRSRTGRRTSSWAP